MLIRLILLLLIVLPAARPVLAETIFVGTTPIEIPAPPGYVAWKPDNSELSAFFDQFVPPTNRRLLSLFTEADMNALLRGEITDMPRRFSVQTLRQASNTDLTLQEFKATKQSFIQQNAKDWEKMRNKVNEVLDDASENMDLGTEISLANQETLPIHYQTDRSFAFSILVKTAIDGEIEAGGVAITVTLMRVKGKILYLYAFSQENDLEWSRSSSKAWAEEILQLNPSSPVLQRRENRRRTGIDWGRVADKAVVGGFAGGFIIVVIMLIGGFVKRGKKPPSNKQNKEAGWPLWMHLTPMFLLGLSYEIWLDGYYNSDDLRILFDEYLVTKIGAGLTAVGLSGLFVLFSRERILLWWVFFFLLGYLGFVGRGAS